MISHPRKNSCFKCFKRKKGLSKSIINMQGKEKLPMDIMSEEKMDSCTKNKSYRRIKKKCHRGFSRVVKAVLNKKKQGKKDDDDLSRSTVDMLGDVLRPLRDDTLPYPMDAGENALLDPGSSSISSRYSLFSSTTSVGTSSSACPSVANSRSASERKQWCLIDLNGKPLRSTSFPVRRDGGRNLVIYFVLVCLVGLVFGGKAFAIFITSSCLFLLPCCRREFTNPQVNDEDSLLDSEINKCSTEIQEFRGEK